MSRTFSTNSGSVESLKVLERADGPRTAANSAAPYSSKFRWPRPRRVESSACRRWGGSAAPSPAGAPRPRRHGRAAGPAAARHRAPPDLARGTACASVRPPGSRARPRARSRYLRRPPPRPARCARGAPGPAVRCATAPDRSGSLARSRSARSPACAAGPCCSSCCRSQHASAPSILHVISGTLH